MRFYIETGSLISENREYDKIDTFEDTAGCCLRSIVVVRSLRKGKVVSSILTEGFFIFPT